MRSSFLRASNLVALVAVSIFGSVLARAQAPNDHCANAIAITTTSITGNNNASSVGPDPVPACGTMSNDVWYTYTATCTGTVTATLCSPSTNFDTLMAAWSGSCGCLSEIACNDDTCAGGKSSVTFGSIAGTTYYLSIGGFDGAAGNFGLTVTCSAANPPPFIPLNDHCAAPQVIAEGVVTAGTTQNATTGGGPCPGDPVGSCSVMSNDVWYAFQATCSGTYEARTCLNGTGFDTVVAVWDGTGGCGSLVEVGCNDTGGCTLAGIGNAAIATWTATAGTFYYVSVGGFIGLTGNFSLVVGPTGAHPVLSFFNVGSGSIGYTVVGGPALGLALTAITTFAGAYPSGPFFGVDMTIQQVVDQLNFGYPFLTSLGTCGDSVVGPFFGAPSGITLFAVTVTAQSGTVTPYSNSAPASATIP